MTELHKMMKKYLEVNNCYPCNTFWEKQIREAIKADENSSQLEPLVMPPCHSECLIKNNDGEQCRAKSKRGYFCSRLPTHKGDHVACGVECGMDIWSA